jgi:hypothetical protein
MIEYASVSLNISGPTREPRSISTLNVGGRIKFQILKTWFQIVPNYFQNIGEVLNDKVRRGGDNFTDVKYWSFFGACDFKEDGITTRDKQQANSWPIFWSQSVSY